MGFKYGAVPAQPSSPRRIIESTVKKSPRGSGSTEKRPAGARRHAVQVVNGTRSTVRSCLSITARIIVRIGEIREAMQGLRHEETYL